MAKKRGARSGSVAREATNTARDTRVIVAVAIAVILGGLALSAARGATPGPDFHFGRQVAPAAQPAPAQ